MHRALGRRSLGNRASGIPRSRKPGVSSVGHSQKFAPGRGQWHHPMANRLDRQASSGPERSAAVSAEDNEAIIRRWIEAYNDRDRQAEADLLAPNYVAHVPGAPGPLVGLEAWTQFSGSFAQAFPDIRLTVEDIFSAGEMVAARVAFHGTHQGEFQGMPPTGKEVAFSSIEVNRVVDGKVEEHWVELDLFGLMQQLGAIPEPEHSEEASPT
jgi:steroid delta-isomerase-like uncharacterized protein